MKRRKKEKREEEDEGEDKQEEEKRGARKKGSGRLLVDRAISFVMTLVAKKTNAHEEKKKSRLKDKN